MSEDSDINERQIREFEKIHQSRVKEQTEKGLTVKAMSSLFSKIVEARKKGKGFLNKKDGLFNFHEAHAAGWGFLLIDFYFRLQNGIFLILFITGIGVAWRNPASKEHCSTSAYFKSEIMNNIHYYLLFGALAVILWTQVTGVSPPPVDKGLIASLLGAIFGL